MLYLAVCIVLKLDGLSCMVNSGTAHRVAPSPGRHVQSIHWATWLYTKNGILAHVLTCAPDPMAQVSMGP
jgi:hypothetical protein